MSYSYSSYSSGGYGGDAFSQADLNQDGLVDRGEFQDFVAGGSGAYGAGAYGVGLAGGLAGGVSSYESSYSSGGVVDAGFGYGGAVGLGGATLVGGGVSEYETAYSGGAYGAGAALGLGGTTVQTTNVHYAVDAQGNFQDANPTIIRRPAPGGAATYTQNIRVKFLQPPPVPPPGPIVIVERRPPQPPPPAPLRLRQQAPPLPTPPPLVLRERPPVPPAVVAGRTVVRNLPAIPVPPRSVIIERLPAPPRRPRDIFIERWLQYGPQAKQRTVVQAAGPAVRYPAPRNTIIQYDQAAARVVRNFQRLGVTSYSPAQYVQQYGVTLLDAGTLLSQARAAGVVEDISPPGVVSSSTVVSGGVGVLGGGAVFEGGLAGGSSWESSTLVGGGGWGAGGALVGGGYGGGLLANVADAAFTAGDLDVNGGLDRAEFNNLLSGGADGYAAVAY